MSSNNRRKIENILREPLTRHRFSLNGKIREAQDQENPKPFTLEDLKSFLNGVRTGGQEFRQESLNAIEAVQSGSAPQKPQLDSPEKQLAWGAAFAYLRLNPDAMKSWAMPVGEGVPLSETDLWKQVLGTRDVAEELLSHAHHIREALRNKDTKYAWGEPGSGFSYNRQKDIINIDLMQTMIVGFEHARADVYREIGHALLSASYPKRMQQVFKEMRPLMQREQKAAAKKGPKLTPEEYKKLQLLSTEWQLRHMLFNAAEENVANRFVANMGQQMLQDYGVSINNTAVTHRAIGLTRLPPDKNASEELRRYMNLCNAVQLSFFQNNDLFEDTETGWARVGVDTNLVRKTATLAQRPDGAKDDRDGASHADFKHLRELCGGPKGLENLQPKQHERLYGWGNRVSRADAERKAIIEKIWALYAEDLIQKILKQANDQIEQKMKEAQEKQQQDGQEQDGEDGEEGQESDQSGSGEPQKGKKGQKSKKGKPQRGQQQGDPQSAEDMDAEDMDAEDMDGDGQDSEDNEGGEDQDGQEQDGQEQDGAGEGEEQEADGEDQKEEGAEGKLGADDEETVPVEGVGDMPKSKNSTENPGDEVDPDADASADGDDKDADGEDADGDAKTMEELEQAAEEAGQDGGEADGEDADGEGEEAGKKAGKKKGRQPGKDGKQAGHGDGRSLAELAKQDWRDYPKRVAELNGPIQRVRKIFKEVQKRQLQRKSSMSRSLDILPENGEVKERFNTEAHRNLTIKRLVGGVEKDDLNRFQKDEVKLVPTEIDIVILIDGSGSMGSALNHNSNNPSPLQIALQASVILYEAAAGKDMHMNVYVGLWGDSNPPIIIRPGDDRMKIGKAIEAAKSGLNSGTDFAPAVVRVAKTIGEQRGKSGVLSGFTHVLILSDGDIFDIDTSKEKILTMFKYSDKVTFDTAIISSNAETAMQRMAKSLKAQKPFQEVGVVLGNNPNEVPMEIVNLLLTKVQKCGSFTAIPNSKKRRAMKKAHNKMDQKP